MVLLYPSACGPRNSFRVLYWHISVAQQTGFSRIDQSTSINEFVRTQPERYKNTLNLMKPGRRIMCLPVLSHYIWHKSQHLVLSLLCYVVLKRSFGNDVGNYVIFYSNFRPSFPCIFRRSFLHDFLRCFPQQNFPIVWRISTHIQWPYLGRRIVIIQNVHEWSAE